jgi:Type I phosphodiesterase / nucleotide pyrophosphatase
MARRVVIVLADGLRPDAVTPGLMPSLYSLGEDYVRVREARTVRPSVTVAALASLATGVGPATHRLTEPGLGFLPGLRRLKPVAGELARARIRTAVVGAEMGPAARSIAWALITAAGVSNLVLEGNTARATAAAAAAALGESGLTIVYLPDCDRAGHAHGWMSVPYCAAAAEVDRAVRCLREQAGDALMIVLSDHGGGGVRPNDHDLPHPLNDRITLILGGSPVRRRHALEREASLLDVPPTVLWHFELPPPVGYEGRVLHEAFVQRTPAMAVA